MRILGNLLKTDEQAEQDMLALAIEKQAQDEFKACDDFLAFAAELKISALRAEWLWMHNQPRYGAN